MQKEHPTLPFRDVLKRAFSSKQEDFFSETDERDMEKEQPFDTSKPGKWVTIRGKPVYFTMEQYKTWKLKKLRSKKELLSEEESQLTEKIDWDPIKIGTMQYDPTSVTVNKKQFEYFRRWDEIRIQLDKIVNEILDIQELTEQEFSAKYPFSPTFSRFGLKRTIPKEKEYTISEIDKYSGTTFTSLGLKKKKLDFESVDDFFTYFDFDESKGRWITVKGKHIFLEKGERLKFGEGGKFKKVSGSKKKEVLKKVEKLEKKKKIETEAKRREEQDKRAKKVKPDKPLSEREKKIQKEIEDTGISRKEAEAKHPSKKEVAEKKKKETEGKSKEGKIERKKASIKLRINKLNETQKGKSGWEVLKQINTIAVQILNEAYKEDGNPFAPFVSGIAKIRKDKSITEERRKKLIAQIKGLQSDIKEIQSKKDFTDKILTPQDVTNLFNKIKENVQEHIDFVNEHLDFLTEDVTGLPSELSPGQLKKLEEIESLLKTTPALTGKTPDWFNYPMTPVMSSFVKGVGAYKGRLLVEYHHDPGNIHGYDVNDQEATLLPELLNSESKGGWVWDKLLGKPSIYGMAKGTFHAFEKNGKMNYFTSKGAQFVHLFGRPLKYKYNPVGYMGDDKQLYEQIAETTKKIKEKIVEPPTSREPISAKLLEAEQGRRTRTLSELSTLIGALPKDMIEVNQIAKQVVRKVDLTEDFDTTRPGKWITTKYGKRVYIYDIEFYTEAELNPNYNVLISPILKIDKRLELGYQLDAINNTINSLPVNLTNMVNEIRVYKKITQDPSMRSDKGKVPDAYKKVGWKKTYDQISGVYLIEDNNIILTPDAFWGTVRHEIGHAVWYGLKERDRIKFKELHKEKKLLMLKVARKLISESKKYDKDSWEYLIRKERAEGIRYEANDVEEYFAEGFNRYYEAKAPIYSWQERKNQKQPSSELAHFFRTRMRKYEKEKEVNPFEAITNIV